MRKTTSFTLAVATAIPLLGLLAAGTGLPRARAGASDEPDAAALFRKNCASCHAVPDPAIRADRAWLGQLERTA